MPSAKPTHPDLDTIIHNHQVRQNTIVHLYHKPFVSLASIPVVESERQTPNPFPLGVQNEISMTPIPCAASLLISEHPRLFDWNMREDVGHHPSDPPPDASAYQTETRYTRWDRWPITGGLTLGSTPSRDLSNLVTSTGHQLEAVPTLHRGRSDLSDRLQTEFGVDSIQRVPDLPGNPLSTHTISKLVTFSM